MIKKLKTKAIIVAIFVIIAALSILYIGDYSTDSSHSRFDDVQNRLEISESDMHDALESVYNTLRSGTGSITIPNNLRQDKQPRILFLSLSDSLSNAQVVIGRGYGFESALKNATKQFNLKNFNAELSLWIKLDIVQEVRDVEKYVLGTSLDFERSLEGIVFEDEEDIAFLPEELVAYNLFDSDSLVDTDNIYEYLELLGRSTDNFDKYFSEDSVNIRRFVTDSFFYDVSKTFQLFRGHRLFDNLSYDELFNASKNAGSYLIDATNTDGSFVYTYQTKHDTESSDYNLLRHAGTIYSMLDLYEYTSNAILLKSAERAISYLLNCVQPFDNVSCIVYGDEVKLGGAALGIIALAEHAKVTGDEKHMSVMQQLGKYIQQSQKESGEFICKRYYSTGEISDFVSEYYPGEAILALCRLYALDDNESWLDTAEAAVDYLINVRDADVPTYNLIHDHWLLMGLNELYRYRDNYIYFNQSMRIAEAIMYLQRDGINRMPEYSDWMGSYYTPPRSTPTATRSEGLIAAYHLANDFGNKTTTNRILNAIDLGIRFQLQTQFLPENVMYVDDPQRALGGFHADLTNYNIRIDYVQHNICSILGFYDIMKNEY